MSKEWRKVSTVLLAVAVSTALLLVMLLGIVDNGAQAQSADTPTPAPTATQDDGKGYDMQSLQAQGGKLNQAAYGNMDSLLNNLVEQVEQGTATPLSAAAQAPMSHQDSVAVAFHIEAGTAEDLRQFLEGSGASPRNVSEDYIEAYVPVSLLAQASMQEGVIGMMAIIPPQPAQGRVVSEGVAVHGADVWQQAGIRGEGVKIGIIDVGFLGFQAFMGTDLPSAGRVQGMCFGDAGQFTYDVADCDVDDDHGSIVTEAAFDVAPEATYYISNPGSWSQLRAATAWMASQGVEVINHSVGWTWSGRGDGTSPVSTSPLNTVNYAASEGVLWVNAAGNNTGSVWLGPFTDPEDNSIHNFEGSYECNSALMETGDRLIAQLRWDDVWLAPTKDLDLYLINTATGEIVALSENFQVDYPYPFELLQYTAKSKGAYCLAVTQFSGESPDWIQLEAFTGQYLAHYTLNGSITTPAESNNPGMLAVGAAPWYDTTTIEPFSSRGPTPDGRIKPDVVGADHADSAGTGPWRGTSQAAPHVAGLAALVKENFQTMGPVDLAGYLEDNALERGEPGPDNTWGYGFAVLPASDAPYDPCFTHLGSFDEDGRLEEVDGEWDGSCVSERPPQQGSGDRYAQFYTFKLSADSDITIELSSDDADTYLYLMKGAGKGGELLTENDDSTASDSNSRIAANGLEAGEYTIEATTFRAATGGEFSLALTAQAADKSPTPTPVPKVEGFVEISYGSDHACALHEDGSISCWGSNEYGKATPPSGDFKSVSSGEHGTCALRSDDGKIVCWGIFELNK